VQLRRLRLDCPSEFDLDLDQWSDRINAQLKSARYPLSGIIELTTAVICAVCIVISINPLAVCLPSKVSLIQHRFVK
jgi:hypothetical protein